MHYFIDGYNMLFRLLHAGDDLQRQREQIIHELNKKASLLQLNASIVFDAKFQPGGRTRSHYDSLEILFTSAGETADEFIIDELKQCSNPRQEIVVTSDKQLAWYARCLSAQTESVEDFVKRLDKTYKNKWKQLKTTPPIASSSPPIIKPRSPTPSASVPTKEASTEACQIYYESIFEANFQAIIESERQEALSKAKTHKAPPRKKKKSVFDESQSSIKQAPTEMERWLKAFEENMNASDPFSNE